MKPILLFCFIIICALGFTSEEALIIYDVNNKAIVVKIGNTEERLSPCCTFNIALCLMGFEEGILQDAMNPLWPFEEGNVDYFPQWKQAHSPTLWIANSCVWYSQKLTKLLGLNKLQEYVDLFNYGNQDLSSSDALTKGWLSSCLKISPEEQVLFLEKIVTKQFPLAIRTYEMTKQVLFVEELDNQWKIYGKTGTGFLHSTDDLQMGWFIGWVEKQEKTYVFACLIKDKMTMSSPTGKDAKEKIRALFSKL